MCGSTKPALKGILTAVVGLSLYLGTARPVWAYEPDTHREIGRTAANRSRLDGILRNQYGVENGVAENINGQEIREWIGTGSNLEDVPFFRALNHFHNPLQPWPHAGGLFGQSSIYWQQNPNQGRSGTWSWPFARSRFFDFLTKPSKGEREAALADTSRALGQVMHMLQDATSPPHTRDDPHLIFDGYEARIEELRQTDRARFDQLLSAPSLFPSTSIFTPTGDLQAPVPIARLIDSDTYAGTLASYSTGGQVGLAEYTNGGYVSDDTIFLDFPLPRPASLGAGFFDPPAGTPGARQYFPKVTDGDPVSHLVAEGTLFERLRFRGQLLGGFILEDKTYEAAASNLLPRAVGYSAALLDYFFRGKLDAQMQDNRLTITNGTPGERMDGPFTLYYEKPDGSRVPLAGGTLALGSGEASEFQVPVPPQDPSPVNCLVVFRGQLGLEPDAVAGFMVTCPSELPPPPPPVGPFFASLYNLYFHDQGPRACAFPLTWDIPQRDAYAASTGAYYWAGWFTSRITYDPTLEDIRCFNPNEEPPDWLLL